MNCKPKKIFSKKKSYNLFYRIIVIGFSNIVFSAASHCAPIAPSTTRWSQLNVTVTIGAVVQLSSSSLTGFLGITVSMILPIANAQHWGDIIIGAADLTPNLPIFWKINLISFS